MGERKGQNHYYPPDFNPEKHKNLNRYHGTHALRERAAKIGQGILIIRFEMPFNVWCLSCENHIGMGVRYNAEKKKIGMFHTTPLYEFRMQCHLCASWMTIRTDPEHFDYEMVEGVRRQEKRWDPSDMAGFAPIDRGESVKLAVDPMYKLEHVKTDADKSKSAAPRLNTLEKIQMREKDYFAANQVLRHIFRTDKKERTDSETKDADLLARSSLTGSRVKLVPENEDDIKLARLIASASTVTDTETNRTTRRKAIIDESIFRKKQQTAKAAVDKPSSSSSVSGASTSATSSSASSSTVNSVKRHSADVVLAVKSSVRQSVLSSNERKRKADAQSQHQLITSIVRPKHATLSSTKRSNDAIQMDDEKHDNGDNITTSVQNHHLSTSLSTLANYATSSDSD